MDVITPGEHKWQFQEPPLPPPNPHRRGMYSMKGDGLYEFRCLYCG